MNVINFLNRIGRDFTRPELAEEARRLADELSDSPKLTLTSVLRGAEKFVRLSDHGDNCFVSDHYEGDPGDRCNCGRDELLSAIEAVLQDAQSHIPFAEDYKGPRVNYHGLLARCAQSTGGMHGELLRQMQEHLSDLGQRFYDGDLAVVDEFLQFYCIGGGARSAAKQEAQGGAA